MNFRNWIWLLALGFSTLSRELLANSQEKSYELNPITIYKNNKGVKLYSSRKNTEARQQFEEALADKSDNLILRFNWASNRLIMAFPQDGEGKTGPQGESNPKDMNQKILDESLGELRKIYQSYLPQKVEDEFYKALNYQLGLAYELKQSKTDALKHYYAALSLKPANPKLDEFTQEAIKRLLVSDSSSDGGGGGGGQSDKKDKESNGDAQGDKEEQKPQYSQGQGQQPKFSGTDIDEQQAKKILESVQGKEQEVQKRKIQKEAKEKSQRGNQEGQSFGRGKQW
jgi:hypothetical protein